jgi:hypothetical protein
MPAGLANFLCSVPERKRPLAMPVLLAKISRMPTATAKRRGVRAEAMRLVRGLPASSSWDDLMYRIYVRQKIEAGLTDFRSGRVHTHASIRKEFGLA